MSDKYNGIMGNDDAYDASSGNIPVGEGLSGLRRLALPALIETGLARMCSAWKTYR